MQSGFDPAYIPIMPGTQKTYDSMPDPELMQETRLGHTAAFGVLVARYQQPLMNFYRRLGVYTDAEDMVQEVFLRLYRYRDRYRPTAKFTTFLYMIARQVRLDMLRKRVRREEFSKEYAGEMEDKSRVRGVTDSKKVDVAACLDKLPDSMKELIVLSIFQGIKYAEISEMLDVPVGTIKSRMFSALRQLKDMLAGAGA